MFLHPDPRTFGERLRLARLHAGLTQQQLADRIHVRYSEISRLERGETTNPGQGRVKQLADALGVTADMLLGRQDEDATRGTPQ